MTTITDFISDLTVGNIPEAALRTARLCLLDAVGCMVSGMNYPPIFEMAETISRSHPGSSVIAATPYTSTRAWAAFINTHAGTYFDLDDGHRKAQGHPGGVIVPLSLMLAAEMGCSGGELLSAIVAGYETAVRSALIMRQAGGPRKGSGAWSVTGGTAAAAKLCSLTGTQMRNALGLAEYYAPQAPQEQRYVTTISTTTAMVVLMRVVRAAFRPATTTTVTVWMTIAMAMPMRITRPRKPRAARGPAAAIVGY